jgi:hypothetical protein
MKRFKEQAEVIVRLDYQDQQAHICVADWPAMAARMESGMVAVWTAHPASRAVGRCPSRLSASAAAQESDRRNFKKRPKHPHF